ncbi:MAG: hypothetical protein ACE5E3_00990 [Mariprofundus sp.]
MVGILFAALCWGIWQLSPHNVAMLAFEKDAILAGEWWRLWTAHFTHFKYSQLLINTIVIALLGLIAGHFAKIWQFALILLIAMPVMTGLLLLTTPNLLFFRGAVGVAAMVWMIATWFLIVESKRFSLGYWLGLVFLLLFIGKVGMEGLALLSPSASRFAGLQIAWLVQLYGTLVGLAFFNALHQMHVTNAGDNPQYRGPYGNKPNRAAQLNKLNQSKQRR